MVTMVFPSLASFFFVVVLFSKENKLKLPFNYPLPSELQGGWTLSKLTLDKGWTGCCFIASGWNLKTNNHTHWHSHLQAIGSINPKLHVFGQWVEAGAPWRNPLTRRKHSDREALTQQGITPESFLLWGNSDKPCTTPKKYLLHYSRFKNIFNTFQNKTALLTFLPHEGVVGSELVICM